MLRILWNRLTGRARPQPDPLHKATGAFEGRSSPAVSERAPGSGPSNLANPARDKIALPRAIPPRGPIRRDQTADTTDKSPLVRRRIVPWRQIALTSVAVSVILAVAATLYASQAREPRLTQPAVQTIVAEAMASATPAPSTAALVYQRIAPSVVLISTSEGAENSADPGMGLGSGVVIDIAGHILTSLHVVDGARQIEVTFADGTTVGATIEANIPEKDIAVLSLSEAAPMIVPATLGNPEALNVGDEAIAVGNPFGLRHTLTAGVISGLHRDFESPETGQKLEDLIQFDTAVNPGNSGGPLLNRDGEVVGIVTALANPTDEKVFIGIGFAVPIDVAAGAAGPPPF